MTRRCCARVLGTFMAGALLTGLPAAAQYAVPQTTDAVPRMEMADFKARLDKGEVIAVDVRSLGDYRVGHIPGSRSIPLNEVAARIDELRGLGKPIVTYCT